MHDTRVAAAFALFLALTALAASGGLDQAHESHNHSLYLATNNPFAQTVTCGTNGYLLSVELYLVNSGAAAGDVAVNIVQAPGGVPNRTNVAAAVITQDRLVTGWNTVTYASPPVYASGMVFGIEVAGIASSTTQHVWRCETNHLVDPYPAGQAWLWKGTFYQPLSNAYERAQYYDFTFRTHMLESVPAIEVLRENGWLTWSGALSNAHYRLEWAPEIGDWRTNWAAFQDILATGDSVTVRIPMFFRVVGQ